MGLAAILTISMMVIVGLTPICLLVSDKVKSSIALNTRREKAKIALKFYAIGYFRNLFWGMVAGVYPLETTPLGYLAEAVRGALYKLPHKDEGDYVELEWLGWRLGFDLYREYEQLRNGNPEYPQLFIDPTQVRSQGRLSGTQGIADGFLKVVLGWCSFEHIKYTKAKGDTQVESHGWALSTYFVTQLLRLKQKGIAALIEPLPPLTPDKDLLKENEYPEYYRKLLERQLFVCLPGVRESQKAIDALRSARDPSQKALATQLQTQLNDMVAAAFSMMGPREIISDVLYRTDPSLTPSAQIAQALVADTKRQLDAYREMTSEVTTQAPSQQ